jgi:hypothetical protein
MLVRYAVAIALAATPVAAALEAQTGAQSTTEPGPKEFTAVRVAGEQPGIRIDGQLDDAAWASARWRTDFLQKVPAEGGEPSGRTEVAFVYDEDALYVAARMFSRDASRIPTAVTRRDQFSNAEHLVIALDTYRDRRTAYSFIISSGGVRGDYYHPSDAEGSRDYTWDPVWEAKTSIDSDSWIAEVRIPFSQLRFSAAGAQDWGVQINRWMPHVDEDVYWVVIPANETGWASRFGALRGIDGVKPSRRLEVVPYVAGNAVFAPSEAGDPFNDGSSITARAGADLKMGLGPNLTLDATVNPDFGQVEADPAEVNLSAFETIFDERRPFFTEGAQLLRGNGQNFFYSRRIGQTPRGGAGGDFVDRATNATILGAAKVTGRMRSGLSVGALAAVTNGEDARTFDIGTGTFGRTEIEPLTGYGIGRVQQEFGANSSVAGLSITAVQRDMATGTPLAALLNRSAITGGGDFLLRSAGAAYEVGGGFGFSHVSGDAAAIDRLQRNSAHFMQRPDATEFTLDPTRTSLTGWSASLRGAKNSGLHWLYNGQISMESPTFDLNDVGRLGSANDIDATARLRYRETRPGRLFQRWSSEAFLGRSWNFGGVHTGTNASLANSLTFRNFWNVFLGAFGNTRAFSDDLTRGGPIMAIPGAYGFDVELSTNDGRSTSARGSVGYFNDELDGWRWSVGGGVSARPSPQWRVSIDPSWSRSVTSRQYVTERPNGPAATYGQRYIFAYIDRHTLAAQMRVNYAFTPDLSLELYAEPFAASGRYYDFGELAAARSSALRTYGTAGTTAVPQADGSVLVQADGEEFSIANRDFNVLSFRSNLVLRWEWLRGSTLFLVWQQDRSGNALAADPVGVGSLFDTFSASGRNFVAVKMTYWMAAR